MTPLQHELFSSNQVVNLSRFALVNFGRFQVVSLNRSEVVNFIGVFVILIQERCLIQLSYLNSQ